ncbi:MAG: single-stranded DNA-binding protein [Bacteroidales bacterium]
MSFNKVLLIGNVGKDPEVRHLESGSAVASFTLATTERFKDKNGALADQTEWHNIVCWRNLAELVEKYVTKGTQLFIEGKIRSRSWTDKEGQKRYTTEIIADNIRLLGKRGDNPAAGGAPQGSYGAPQGGYQSSTPAQENTASASEPDFPIGETSDDLPF